MTPETLKTLAHPENGLDTSNRAILDALPAAVYVTDVEGRLTYYNAAAAQLSGRTPDLGVDRWCVTWKLFLPDGTPLPHDQCPMALVLKGEKISEEREYIAERPDGTRFWFIPYPAAIRNAEGKVTGGINVLIDITARKLSQSQAEIAAQLLSAIVDSTDDAIISKDLKGTITSWNKSAERLFGYTADEVIGQSITLLIPPDRINEETRILELLNKGERVDHFETLRRKKDGTLLDISLSISPVKDASGRIIGASKIVRDTTESKHAERGARLLAAIVDSSDDAIVSKDLNGTITSWNKGAERLFGYTAEEIIGRSVTVLIPTDRLEEEPQILARLRNGERVDHFETVRRRKDGTLLDISLTISPVRDAKNKIVGASKVARDITARKRIDAELRRVNQDLEQFAYSASHDLQEPLRTVKLYSEMLAQRYHNKLDGPALEFLDYVQSGATRMEMLVKDLLAYTQITKMEGPAETTDANTIVALVRENLAGSIRDANAVITADPLPAVPMHSAHLLQLFQNLISNAIKYRNPKRTPEVHVSGQREPRGWRLAVTDNGIGIAQEYKESVFGLFKRLHSNQEYAGTGIGLAICQRIVQQYHGRIWVESKPGQGSTFYFSIPDQRGER